MSYAVKLLPVVHIDLKKAKNWYNEKKVGVGEEFKSAVNKEIDYIGKYPEHYQRKYKELRQSFLYRFPYSVFYLIDEPKKHVIILGVLHMKRNPEVVRRRT